METPVRLEVDSKNAATSASAREITPPASACLHHVFEAQAARTPQAIALTFEGQHLTYEELNVRADALAAQLQSLGLEPDMLVGLCMEPSFDMVAGILGILKAGGAYLPLHPAHPQERLAMLWADAQPRWVVTQRKLASLLAVDPPKMICLDEPQPWPKARWVANPVTPDSLAYVLYTSGSTGKPKGVQVTHRNVVRLLQATQPEYQFTTGDVWTLFHSFAFDFSVWEIWGALAFGGRLVIVPHAVSRTPEQFFDLLVRERVTVLNQTPSAFIQLIQAEESANEKKDLALRLILLSGEALEMACLRPWFNRHGDQSPQLVNLYGITETTVFVTWRSLTAADVDQPSVIGKPIPGWELYLLDEQLQPVREGDVGEIFVGGAGVARGYLNRSELTAQRFVRHPFSADPQARLYRSGDLARRLPNGDLEYRGRIDHQVKIRGHRIELGEIESALNQHPAVQASVVVQREDTPGAKRLVAYLVSRQIPAPSASELRCFLLQRIPDYMVPAHFVRLAALPLTLNGKVDRQALPAPSRERPPLDQPYLAPRDALEGFLADVWREVLQTDQVGIHDKFFELGGDSLLGAACIDRLQEKLGEQVFVVALFEAPTVADLASYLKKHYPAAVARVFGGSSGAETVAPSSSRPVDREMVDQARRLIKPLAPRAVGAHGGALNNPPAMFILAPPRSGTSLLRVMLAGHPKIFAASELQLLNFNTLPERKEFFDGKYKLWLEGAIRALMEVKGCDAEEATRLMSSFEAQGLSTKEFYGMLQKWISPKLLVDKTPAYGLDVNALRRAEEDFENALYIHLVRHPVTTVRSFEKNRLDQVYFTYCHSFSARELAELYWVLVHQNTLEFLQTVPARRQYRLRFEDLVARPRQVMEEMCGTFGLAFHPDMLEPYKNPEKKMLDGIHPQSRSMTDGKFHQYQGIDPSAAGEWQECDEEDGPGPVARELARSFGYEMAPAAASRQETGRARRDQLEQRRQLRQTHRQQATF